MLSYDCCQRSDINVAACQPWHSNPDADTDTVLHAACDQCCGWADDPSYPPAKHDYYSNTWYTSLTVSPRLEPRSCQEYGSQEVSFND